MYKLTYNNYLLQNDSTTVITGLTGISSMDIRTSQDVLTGRDGGNIWAQNYDMRYIEVKGTLFANDFTSYYSLRDSIIQAFSLSAGNSLLTLQRPDGVVKTIYAKVVLAPVFIELSGESCEADFIIGLRCGSPFFADNTAQITTARLAVSGGTPISSPIPSPIMWGTGNTFSINNTGDIVGYARFDFTDDCQNPTITNTLTGESFTINKAMAIGDTVSLYIDQTGMHVADGSGATLFEYFAGTFFPMQIGVNNFAFTCSNSSVNALVTVTFYNQYLTV